MCWIQCVSIATNRDESATQFVKDPFNRSPPMPLVHVQLELPHSWNRMEQSWERGRERGREGGGGNPRNVSIKKELVDY